MTPDPEVAYAALVAHEKACRQCWPPESGPDGDGVVVMQMRGMCDTGRELLKAWGDAERREDAMTREGERAQQIESELLDCADGN